MLGGKMRLDLRTFVVRGGRRWRCRPFDVFGEVIFG